MSATGYLDACGFNPASGGTGDFVVSAAIAGYQTPASAGAVNSAVYSYRAQSSDLSQWENGSGAYTTSTTTLARTTVTASSTGSKVSFTSPPNVYITALSADLQNASLLSSGAVDTARLPLGTGANQVPQLDSGGHLLNAIMGASSIGTSGYYTLPGGLIIQWGSASSGVTSVTFPLAFPTAVLSIELTKKSGSNGSPNTLTISKSSFTFDPNYGDSSTPAVFWLAIGN